MSIGKRIVCLLLCMILLLLAAFGAAEIRTVQHSEFDYVFVHGLVNTVSAMAPARAPSAVYSEEEPLPGPAGDLVCHADIPRRPHVTAGRNDKAQ